MENIYITGALHLLLTVVGSSYPFLFKNYTLDILYILFCLSKMLSWLLFKDECIISYLIKKQNNPEYKLGEKPFDLTDIYAITSSFISKETLTSVFSSLIILQSYLFIMVNQRSHILKPKYIYMMIFVYLFYALYLRKFYNEDLFKRFGIDKYDSMIRITLFLISSFITFCLLKKLIPLFPK